MKKHTLQATIRTSFGRKVKKLRTAGLIPANVFGNKIKSVSVAVEANAFTTVYKEAGETGVIALTIESEKETRPVLVHQVQIDPVSGLLLHVEFFQVDLKEKVHARVPLELAGIPPAVEKNIGVLLTIVNEIEVEALPTELPEKIVVDVSDLIEVNQELKVSDLRVPKSVTVLSDAGLTVTKIGALTKVEEVAPPVSATEEGAEGVSAETGEGETTEKSETSTESKDGQKSEDT